jgi:DNA-binding response OmpR family regulator
MRPPSQILVVSRNYPQRDLVHRWLVSAGYQVELAADFDGARSRLDISSPDLLVADVKLGAYNGLHLAIWSRGRNLATKTLLIGEPDRVLQKEAERERAVYMTPPLTEQAFIAAVNGLLGSYNPARRSPRKRVALDAMVDGVLASVVDLSYEGLCLVLKNAEALTLPAFFTLHLPAYDVAYRVQRVWLNRPSAVGGILLCGASLPRLDTETAVLWKSLVDRLPAAAPVTAESAS